MFTVTGTDRVGNSAQAAATYAVTYRLCLLYDPTKPAGSANSTVPVKLRLCDAAGANLSSTSLTVTAVGLDGSPPPPNFSGDANTGYTFRYDAGTSSYVYNLKTKGMSTGSHAMTLSIQGDPVPSHSVGFILK